MRQCCLDWELGALCDDLVILATELVTNAVLHARTRSTVTISVAEGVVEVSVADSSPARPSPRPRRTDLIGDLDGLSDDRPTDGPSDREWTVGDAGSVTGGRGLHVVDALADQWGVRPHTEGKSVWLTVDTPAEWPHQYRCVCAASPTHTTASGHPVARMTPPTGGSGE